MNHFSIIQSHYACRMCSNYPIASEIRRQNWTFAIKCSRRAHNCKLRSLYFTSWKERERLRDVRKLTNARAKRAKLLFFYCQIWKFVSFLLSSSSSWLRELPSDVIDYAIKQAFRGNDITTRLSSTTAVQLNMENVFHWNLYNEICASVRITRRTLEWRAKLWRLALSQKLPIW